MEKKIPEKKVALKESDVFFVYEKRINKCVKDDCEGVVKYGLIIKVEVNEDESINCFECNKCHMKYTPYPNYNRLQNKNLPAIYNASEVAEWCERTQRKVENRNALKNKKPFARQDYKRSFENKRGFGNKREFGASQDRTERYQKRDGYVKKEGYQKREFYQNKDGYQRRDSSYKRDDFQGKNEYQRRDYYPKRDFEQSKDGYQRRERFQSREGYQKQDGFSKRTSYQNREGYQKKDGYEGRYRSNTNQRSNTGKTFTVRKGNIIVTGTHKANRPAMKES